MRPADTSRGDRMDESTPTRKRLSRADRLACILFVVLLLGLFVADLLHNYAPVKLTALFIFLFWMPLMVVHEAGHAVMAAVLNWRVLGVVLGAGPILGRWTVGGVPVQVRLIPFEGFVLPVPRHLRQPRLRSALIYFAGPGAELLVLALLVTLVGPERMLSRSEDVGLLAAQSLAIAILVSVIINLVPHGVPHPSGDPSRDWTANDGLGILRSFWLPDRHFAELMGQTVDAVLHDRDAQEEDHEED